MEARCGEKVAIGVGGGEPRHEHVPGTTETANDWGGTGGGMQGSIKHAP